MADLVLQQPAEGQRVAITPEANSRLVFGYDLSEATLSREGDDLVFTFINGSILVLTDFYVAYTAENMPVLVIDNTEVDGEHFFSALAEDLVPAAGVSAGPQGSGAKVDTIHGELLGGINRLGSLDQEYPDRQDEEVKEPVHYEDNFEDVDTPRQVREQVETTPLEPSDEGNTAPTPEEEVTPEGDDTNSTLPPVQPETEPEVHPEPENEAPQAENVEVDAMESGVGRHEDGSIVDASNPGDENAAYAGGSVTGQVVATDSNGDTLAFSVQDGAGKYGSLSINPETGEFEYIINEEAANGLSEGESATESFTVTVTDGVNSTTTTVTVNVQGTNDAPNLSLSTDTSSVREDSTQSSVTGSWNVDDADGDGQWQSLSVKDSGTQSIMAGEDGSITMDGLYGKLTIHGDGTYEYTLYTEADGDKYSRLDALNTGETAQEEFTIVTTDKHGATSEVPLEIEVQGSADITFDTNDSVQEGSASTGEQALDVGLTGALSTIVVGEGDSAITIIVDGAGNAEDTLIEGTYGSLVLTVKDGNISYEYTSQTDGVQHGGVTPEDSFTLTVTGPSGDSSTGSIDITITDTGPQAVADVTSVYEGAIVTGNILTNDNNGADGQSQVISVVGNSDWTSSTNAENGSTTLTSKYGTLTVNPDGSYSFSSSPNSVDDSTENFVFTYTVTDADGSTSEATLTINPDAAEVPSAAQTTIVVDESGLAQGTESEATSEVVTWQPEGFTVVGHGEYDTTLYDVSIVEGNLIVTLKDTVQHGDKRNPDDSFSGGAITVKVKDEYGNEFEMNVNVTIKDDGPVLESGEPTDIEGHTHSEADVVENMATADVVIDFGADGPGTITMPSSTGGTMPMGVSWNEENGQWESLDPSNEVVYFEYNDGQYIITMGDVVMTSTDNTNWTVSYEVNGRDEAKITFSDSDGDSVTHTVTATAPLEFSADNGTGILTTYDAAVEGVQSSDLVPEEATNMASGSLSFFSNYGVNSFTLGSGDNAVTFTINEDGSIIGHNIHGEEVSTVEGSHGHLQNVTCTQNSADGTYEITYEYVQTETSSEHDKNIAEDSYASDIVAGDSFYLNITDNSGNTMSQENAITTQYVDDVITLDFDSGTDTEQNIYTEYEVTYAFFDRNGNPVLKNGENIHGPDEFPPWGGTIEVLTYRPVENSQVTSSKTFNAEIAADGTSGVGGDVDVKGADGVAAFSIEFLYMPIKGTSKFVEIDGKPVGITSVKDSLGKVTYTAEMDGETYFTLTYDPKSGQWDYEQLKNFESDLALKFTATDGDGDTTVEYGIIENNPKFVGFDLSQSDIQVNVDEAYLSAGTEAGEGDVTQQGHIQLKGDVVKFIEIGEEKFTLQDGEWLTESGQNSVTVGHGSVSITDVSTDPITGEQKIIYEYTLENAVDSGDKAESTAHDESFTVTVGAANGTEASTTVNVDIRDDAPQPHDDVVLSASEGESARNIFVMEFGADYTAGASITVNVNGVDVTATWNGSYWEGADATVDGGTTILTFGNMTLFTTNNEDWMVNVDPNGDASSQSHEIIIRDADGDSSTVNVNTQWTPNDSGFGDPELLSDMGHMSMPVASRMADMPVNADASSDSGSHAGHEDNENSASNTENLATTKQSHTDGYDNPYGDDGDDIFSGLGDGKENIYGSSGDDIIAIESLDIGDVLHVDGGEGNDVLLTTAESIHAVKDKLASGQMENVEVFVFGQAEGDSAQEVVKNLNINDTNRWTESADSGVDGFKELSDDNGITILVAKHQLESGI